MELIKSEFDPNSYRYIILDNKLRCMLISDPKATYSAASVTVGVGSLYDPKGFNGLAHLLEHMLFLGTEKFPEENYFSNYVKNNGGYNNAYTSGEHTNYYYKIQHQAFEHSLEIFSRFFIDPLLTPDAVDREVNAVHSEHSKNVSDDMWRSTGVIREISNPNSVYYNFRTGNKESLYQNRENLFEELKKFHDKYYSANQITVALFGPQTLDTLEEYIRKYYSDIPNLDVDWSSEIISTAFPHNYDLEKLNSTVLNSRRKLNCLKFVKVLPIQKDSTITLIWELPTKARLYKYSMLMVISHFIGDEGEGSIAGELKKHYLINGLMAGPIDENFDKTLFAVTIDLTDLGWKYRHQVISVVHDYIQILREQGLPKEQYEEIRTVMNINFTYPEKQDASDIVTSMSSNMQISKPEDILRFRKVLAPYNTGASALFDEYIQMMHPETCIIILSSNRFENLLSETDKWYGTKYSVDSKVHISPSEKLEKIKFNLTLPPPNKYVPDEYSTIHKNKMNEPEEFEFNGINIIYKTTPEYMSPQVCLTYYLYDTGKIKSIKDRLSLILFYQTKMRELNTDLYPAAAIGYSFGVAYSHNDNKFIISSDGYYDKVGLVVKNVLGNLFHPINNKELFIQTREFTKKQMLNSLLSSPSDLCMMYINKRVNNNYITSLEYLDIIDSIDLDDINSIGIDYLKGDFNKIEMVAVGNVTKEMSIKFANEAKMINSIGTDAITSSIVREDFMKELKISIKNSVLNDVETNSAVVAMWYVGQTTRPDDTPRDEWCRPNVSSILLGISLGETFFDTLRTKQQLGYITSLHEGVIDNSPNQKKVIYALVQSESHSPTEVEKRIIEFIEEQKKDFITKSDFEMYKSTAKNMLLQPFNNMKEEDAMINRTIAKNSRNFKRKEQVAEYLEKYTIEMFKEDFNRILTYPKLVSIVYGKNFMNEFKQIEQ